jgi:hypothetical protein
MHELLSNSPDVFMSHIKEPHFLAGSDVAGSHSGIRTVAEYQSLFAGAEAFRYAGESSTSYLWSKVAAASPVLSDRNSRLIVILREPLERMLSHYWMDVRDGVAPDILRDPSNLPGHSRSYVEDLFSRYGELSCYGSQLLLHQEAFDQGRLLILTLDMYSDPAKLAAELISFLDIELAVQGESIPQRNSYWRARPLIPDALLKSRSLRRLGGHLLTSSRLRRLIFSSRAPSIEVNVSDHWLARFESDRLLLENRFGFVMPQDWRR